ncbi:hypothetical protein CO044_03055 [Candidatus Peregrinibacteria bacterium CG_4_9_14_0_2_um_filter_38_9]|nr:MAG: hypothetical protein CO044_03055 [Candidatus Peregrinibacteria bacterium CG_4_9_14_0_2_um_filter_38_9]
MDRETLPTEEENQEPLTPEVSPETNQTSTTPEVSPETNQEPLTPEVAPVTPETPSKKLGLFAIIGAVIVTAIAGGIYYFSPTEATPPELIQNRNTYQGFIEDKQFKAVQWEKKDIEEYEIRVKALKTAGIDIGETIKAKKDIVNTFSAKKDTNLKEIFDFTSREERKRIIFGIYLSDLGTYTTTKNDFFNTIDSKGRTILTMVDPSKPADLEKIKIKENEAVSIMADYSPELHFLNLETVAPVSAMPLDYFTKGWHAVAVKDFEGLMENVDPLTYSAWGTKNNKDFVKLKTPSEKKSFNNIMWINVKVDKLVKKAVVDKTATGNATTGNPQTDAANKVIQDAANAAIKAAEEKATQEAAAKAEKDAKDAAIKDAADKVIQEAEKAKAIQDAADAENLASGTKTDGTKTDGTKPGGTTPGIPPSDKKQSDNLTIALKDTTDKPKSILLKSKDVDGAIYAKYLVKISDLENTTITKIKIASEDGKAMPKFSNISLQTAEIQDENKRMVISSNDGTNITGNGLELDMSISPAIVLDQNSFVLIIEPTPPYETTSTQLGIKSITFSDGSVKDVNLYWDVVETSIPQQVIPGEGDNAGNVGDAIGLNYNSYLSPTTNDLNAYSENYGVDDRTITSNVGTGTGLPNDAGTTTPETNPTTNLPAPPVGISCAKGGACSLGIDVSANEYIGTNITAFKIKTDATDVTIQAEDASITEVENIYYYTIPDATDLTEKHTFYVQILTDNTELVSSWKIYDYVPTINSFSLEATAKDTNASITLQWMDKEYNKNANAYTYSIMKESRDNSQMPSCIINNTYCPLVANISTTTDLSGITGEYMLKSTYNINKYNEEKIKIQRCLKASPFTCTPQSKEIYYHPTPVLKVVGDTIVWEPLAQDKTKIKGYTFIYRRTESKTSLSSYGGWQLSQSFFSSTKILSTKITSIIGLAASGYTDTYEISIKTRYNDDTESLESNKVNVIVTSNSAKQASANFDHGFASVFNVIDMILNLFK